MVLCLCPWAARLLLINSNFYTSAVFEVRSLDNEAMLYLCGDSQSSNTCYLIASHSLFLVLCPINALPWASVWSTTTIICLADRFPAYIGLDKVRTHSNVLCWIKVKTQSKQQTAVKYSHNHAFIYWLADLQKCVDPLPEVLAGHCSVECFAFVLNQPELVLLYASVHLLKHLPPWALERSNKQLASWINELIYEFIN